MNLKALFKRRVEVERISDGIDIDNINKVVSFNPNHQKNVDTNDPYNPQPRRCKVKGYTCISVFLRKETSSKLDGNPLIYALKNFDKVIEMPDRGSLKYKKMWKFKNPQSDIMALMKRFVAVTKEFEEPFDTIIVIPSSSKLNEYVAKCINRIRGGFFIKKFFKKLTANIVEDLYLDEEFVLREYPVEEQDDKFVAIRTAFDNMRKRNNGMFSYKYFEEEKLRGCVEKSMEIPNDIYHNDNIASRINGKRILVIDDTITTKGTLSESAEALENEYSPRDIVFFTLFSPLIKDKKE